MGISVGYQVLSKVVDTLFGNFKPKFVYNFINDMVVYSRSLPEHLGNLAEVFKRLEKPVFTLNPDNLRLGQAEIVFLGLLVLGQRVTILHERVKAIRSFPTPSILREFGDLWEWRGSRDVSRNMSRRLLNLSTP
jgi:hypothetical protein